MFVNHQQHNWVNWLPLGVFAADNRTSESTKCALFSEVPGVDPRMLFAWEPTKEQVQQFLDADQVQITMQQVHEHLRTEICQSQAGQLEGANCERTPAPNVSEGSHVWLDV